MKLFIFFLLMCAILSMALQKRGKAPIMIALIGISAFVMVGYYFFNQI